ncbi:putative nuclease HARBI1 [Heterodontus francisci]|uniref:putative nuclease HARBI1 n=1 Tax=Heterodontus francisci TaxID=7792 RepID=UPI00355B6E19
MLHSTFLAGRAFQGSTGDICDISQSVAHRCIKEVTNALFRHADELIDLAVDEDNQDARSADFSVITGFHRVQEVIDCSHVAIRAPWDQPAVFVNRKCFHSLNVQLVCDHRSKMMQVCTHFSGSCHNSYILRKSLLPGVFGAQIEVDCWILGDKGYPLCTWLMTPVRHPQCAAEERYNAAHASTRAIIKNIIGRLKMCLHCLDQSGKALQYTPERVSRTIIVCHALHNLAIRLGSFLQVAEQEEHQSSSDEDDYEEGEGEDNNANDAIIDIRAMERQARDIRENLIFSHFSQQ